MSVPPGVFDDDYLYFCADILGDERSDADAEVVARLLWLRPGMRVLDVPCGEGRTAGRLTRRGCEVVASTATSASSRSVASGTPTSSFGMRPSSTPWSTGLRRFGCFDAATDDSVVAGFARVLRPGGRLALVLHDSARLARLLEPTGGTSAMVVERRAT